MKKSYLERANAIQPSNDSRSLIKDFLTLIETKKTNLCLSIDTPSPVKILSIAKQIGPYICLLKTHVDIINFQEMPFDEFIKELRKVANGFNFMIFEDRKFADIGNTVYLQYKFGYRIVEWAEFTNCHVLPGEGIIGGLKRAVDEFSGDKSKRGLLLLAEMSCDNLITKEYTEKCVEFAKKNEGFVVGFIAGKRVCDEGEWLLMTPGVNLTNKGDALGQKYRSPEEVMMGGTDVVIVGRGIYEAENSIKAAEEYRQRCWDAYLGRLK